MREIALVCGVMIFLNRYSTFLGLDPALVEALPDRWYARVLRPLAGFAIRALTRRGVPTPFPPAARSAPFARVLQTVPHREQNGHRRLKIQTERERACPSAEKVCPHSRERVTHERGALAARCSGIRDGTSTCRSPAPSAPPGTSW